jgi:cytochrome b561
MGYPNYAQRLFRYHPLLVGLHWMLELPIVAMLCAGLLLLALMQDVDPHKIGLLMIHMAGEWSSSP